LPTAAASPATDDVGRRVVRAGDPDKRAGGRGNAAVSQPHQRTYSAAYIFCGHISWLVLHSVTVEAVSQLPCIKFGSMSNVRYVDARYNGAPLYPYWFTAKNRYRLKMTYLV